MIHSIDLKPAVRLLLSILLLAAAFYTASNSRPISINYYTPPADTVIVQPNTTLISK